MAKKRNRSHWNPANKHVVLFRNLFESPAYRDLTPGARDVLHELMYRFNGINNGRLPLSVREAAERTNCSDNTAQKRLEELQNHGFIKCAQKGAFTRKDRHASEWTITFYDLDNNPPTSEYRNWKEENAV